MLPKVLFVCAIYHMPKHVFLVMVSEIDGINVVFRSFSPPMVS